MKNTFIREDFTKEDFTKEEKVVERFAIKTEISPVGYYGSNQHKSFYAGSEISSVASPERKDSTAGDVNWLNCLS